MIGALAACTLAHGQEGPSEPPRDRDLRGIIVSFDAATGELLVRHRPTEHMMKLRVGNNTRISIWRQVDLDELPDGQPLIGWGRIDEKNKVFNSGIYHVREESPALKIGISSNSLTGRLQRRPTSEPAKNLTSRDGKFELLLFDGQSAWTLSRAHDGRPAVFRAEPGTAAEFEPGREIEFQYRSDNPAAGGELQSARVSILFPGGVPYYMNQPGGPTGMKAATLEESVQKVKQNHQSKAAELARLMPVKMRVVPELARQDEPQVVRLEALAERQPSPKVELRPHYLQSPPPSARELALSWRATGEKRHGLEVYAAELPLPSLGVGQHLLRWECDIGGDINEYWRSYAVADDETTICTFQVNNRPPDLQQTLQRYYVPYHHWTFVPLELGKWANPNCPSKAWADVSRDDRQYGAYGEFGLQYYPWGAGQVREDPPQVQMAGLKALQTVAPLLGFAGPVNSFWNYTMGNETVRLAREAGYRSVSAMCTENHVDGNMAINHTGRPERPYFMAADDFRKSGPGGPDGMVGFAQVQRHTILARRYLCDYNIEPGNGALNAGAGGRDAWDDVALSRLFDFYHALFEMQPSQKVPFVIQQCLEFSGSRVGAAEGNRMMVEYAARKAATGKVVFSNVRALGDYYRRHYTQTPETTAYFHDYWAGVHAYQKPALFPDVLQIENHLFSAMFVGGGIVPEYHYDYTRPWKYPDFGNEGLPRKRDGFGYPDPDNYDRFAWTPTITDTRAMSAQRKDEQKAGKLVVTLTVRSDRERKQFPLALWDLPREWKAGEGWYQAGGARFVPVKVPFTHNLSGVLVVDLKAGENRLTLMIDSPPRPPATLDVAAGNLRGKVFERDGRAMAYVYPAVPWEVSFELTVPEGKCVQYYAAPKGERVDLPPGTHKLVINKEQWSRIVGLSREELAANLREVK
ncbi:MAG: hypothetical protein WCI73_09225 [Phycisphaerae bacterium]